MTEGSTDDAVGANTTMGKSEESGTIDSEKKKMAMTTTKRRRRWWPHIIFLPYLVGILWHVFAHPIWSVFTGDFSNARRWYIDESSIDPQHFRMNHKYTLLSGIQKNHHHEPTPSLCEILLPKHSHRGIDCHRAEVASARGPGTEASSSLLEVARIVPTANAIAPVSEAIVVVVRPTSNWYASQFHYSVLQLLHRLSSPDISPWLAKTIFLVSSFSPSPSSEPPTSLHDTVDSFLYLYLGPNDAGSGYVPSEAKNRTTLERQQLPPHFTGAVIRHLLVLDHDTQNKDDSTKSSDLRILPQGSRGVLPNMDLVFLCTTVFSRSTHLSRIPHNVHPFQSEVNEWAEGLNPKIPDNFHRWSNRLLNLLAFEYTLLSGSDDKVRRPPPHASALDRGIDALTIQGVFVGDDGKGGTATNDLASAELVSRMEPILRGLSNLYERLHHSTSLFLLVSSERFVKHEEYLVPNLLLAVPFLVRAVKLIFFDIPRFQLLPVQRALSRMLLGVVISSFGLCMVNWLAERFEIADRIAVCHCVIAAAYLPTLQACLPHHQKRHAPDVAKSTASNISSNLQSIQFVACLLGVYIHVPITFGHVALAFPSALLFTPLIAFPSYNRNRQGSNALLGLVSTIVRWSIFFSTIPLSFLVPRIFSDYTPYVRYGYLPLHMLASTLLLSNE